MTYEIGQALSWLPANDWEAPQVVYVQAIRRGGKALLSNGWIVDEDGYADGSARRPGGKVVAA